VILSVLHHRQKSLNSSFFSSYSEYQIMGKVEKPSDSECYVTSSKPFKNKQDFRYSMIT
jgi:hypothetical protein